MTGLFDLMGFMQNPAPSSDRVRLLRLGALSLGLLVLPAVGRASTFGSTGSRDLLDPEGSDDEDEAALFADSDDDEHGDATLPPPGTRSFLLEPAGLAVLPILTYGLGFAQELPWGLRQANRQPWSVRARYARGSAKLGDLDVVAELTTLEATWTFYRSVYVAFGPAYRSVRAALEDTVIADAYTSGSTATAGLTLAFGIQQSLGTYVLGCDIAGIVQPVGRSKRRGVPVDEIDDRDPHAEALARAADGASTSVLRVYFGPRF